MRVYRICKREYAKDLSGEGARKVGGRWNSKGIPMLYTSSSVALATLEILVHLQLNIMPKNLVTVEIEFPDNLKIKTVKLKDLDKAWNQYPAGGICSSTGDAWSLSQSTPLLRVPSAIIQSKNEFNILANPLHPTSGLTKVVKVSEYSIDQRLIKNSKVD